MSITPDRWITSVFKHPNRGYYVKALDVTMRLNHYFFIMPHGTVAKPAERLDHPGTYILKKDIPPSIRQAIIAYLTELEKAAGQLVMDI